MDRRTLDELKHRVALLDYLREQGWKPGGPAAGGQVAGLCPLHTETHPSFWVHLRRNLFYCHGCGRGGDLLRFIELYHGLTFSQALAHLRGWMGAPALVAEAMSFYQSCLGRHPEARDYLARRGLRDDTLLHTFTIGYAPGGCLRAHLNQLGYTAEQIREAGLINQKGSDTFYRRIVFACGDNLYGRSLDETAPHRFLRGEKGGLYRWERLSSDGEVILAEGVFDVLALYQAGFVNATCGWGTQLNRTQREQLSSGQRVVWIAWDGDAAGQQGALELASWLRSAGQRAYRIVLPPAHDPASYFEHGVAAGAAGFRELMRSAQP